MKSITDIMQACGLPEGSRHKLSKRIENEYHCKDLMVFDIKKMYSEEDFEMICKKEISRKKKVKVKEQQRKFRQKKETPYHFNRNRSIYSRIGW